MPTEPEGNGRVRSTILRDIKTPLTFFALALLVTESVLGILATQVSGLDRTLLVVGMVLTLFALILIVAFLYRQRPGNGSTQHGPQAFAHDVFISAPMAAFDSDEQYQQNRADILKLVDAFKKECKFKSVVYAGQEITSIMDFEAADISAAEDINALRQSKYFVLCYPEKIVSSVLFEAGVALAWGKPSLFFVRDRRDLPFLMRQADQAFSKVRIYECPNIEDVVAFIAHHGEKLLSFQAAES